jgi:hypothetical protein
MLENVSCGEAIKCDWKTKLQFALRPAEVINK